jgi:hypothetical protein
MKLQATLPKDWNDLKIDNKIIFVNNKEKLISYHPPIEFKNINLFLNFYQFKQTIEEILKIMNSNNGSEIIKNKIEKDNQTNNTLFNSITNSIKQKEKENFDNNPILDCN